MTTNCYLDMEECVDSVRDILCEVCDDVIDDVISPNMAELDAEGVREDIES